MFVIGSESESVMVRWALRILSCNKEVQARLQAELDAVCGPGVDVTWDKRESLPYTMAVMKEIFVVVCSSCRGVAVTTAKCLFDYPWPICR